MSNDLEGSLRWFTLSDVLQLLGFSGQTGTLTLMQGWNSRTMCFEQGRLTYIAAATRLPTVGELLVRAGKLEPTRLRQAMEAAQRGPKSLPSVLLEWSWVTTDDLKRCQDQLLEETIYSLFLWRNCRFTFEHGPVVKEGGLAVDLVTERVIIDGTRRVDEWISISPYVPSMRMTFRRLANGTADTSECSEQDLQVLSQIDGRRDGVALALGCGLTQFEAARSLAHLAQAGLARAAPPDRSQLIALFRFLVESIYVKLGMFGYARIALEFEEELNRFALDNKLKVHMRGGKVTATDIDTAVDPEALIDLYKLFIAIQQNSFAKMFEPEVIQGLVEGLYLHVDPEQQELLQMYQFYQLDGLLAPSGSRASQEHAIGQ